MNPSCSQGRHLAGPGLPWQTALGRIVVIAWTVALFLFGRDLSLGVPLIIDDFAYTNSASARLAWVAGSALPVAMATGGDWGTDQVITLTCDFAVRSVRCYWDRTISLNLSS